MKLNESFSDTATYLMIGGKKDGKRVTTQKYNKTIITPIVTQDSASSYTSHISGEAHISVEGRVETHVKRDIMGIPMFVLDGLSERDVLNYLYSGYKEETPEAPDTSAMEAEHDKILRTLVMICGYLMTISKPDAFSQGIFDFACEEASKFMNDTSIWRE